MIFLLGGILGCISEVGGRCATSQPAACPLQSFRRGRCQDLRLAVKGCDQTIDAVRLKNGSKLGAAGSNFTDRAIEIDIRDQPAVAVAPHHVVDLDRLAIGFDYPALHHDAGWRWLLTCHLQRLPGVAVKAVSVDRRDATPIALGHLLTLPLGQTGPRGADRQPGHRSDVEAAANDWFQLREATALAQYPSVFHCGEQRVIEALHRIAAACRGGMKRVGKHTKPEANGKSDGSAQWHFWRAGLAERLIESRWKRPLHVPLLVLRLS